MERSGAVFEAPAFVSGLDDVAVMSETVEQGRGHFRIAEDARPFAESEIGGDEDRGALIETADEMEEQLASGLGEGQIAEFVEDDEVEPGEMIGDATLSAGAGLGLELVDEIDGGEEPSARSAANAIARDGDCTDGVLPVPVPPTNTALRCWVRKAPAARSRTSASLIGVPLKTKSSTSLASGSLETVI